MVCSESNASLDAKYESAGLKAAEIKKACSQNDSRFFQKNFQILATAFLPPEAFTFLASTCNKPGLLLAMEGGTTGDTITLKATWQPPSPDLPPTTPAQMPLVLSGPITCSNSSIKRGSKISVNPTVNVCQRTGDGQVTAVLRTLQGDAFATATRRAPDPPKPTYVLTMWQADDEATCRLNGKVVGQSAINIIVSGIILAPTPGKNTLICTQTNRQPPAWKYHYELFMGKQKVWDVALNINDGSSTGDHVVSYDFDY